MCKFSVYTNNKFLVYFLILVTNIGTWLLQLSYYFAVL